MTKNFGVFKVEVTLSIKRLLLHLGNKTNNENSF